MRGAALLAAASPAAARPGTRYRAAVVETGSVNAAKEPLTLDAARRVKLQNAAALETWAGKAAAEGADIVVFGEDFADSGWAMPAGANNLYAEPLPPPGPGSLCSDAASATMPVASAAACAAMKHNITIATGLGDLGKCVTNLSPFTRKPFPCDNATGLTAFNSIGVFGPDGSLLAKYHKSHLARGWSVEYEPWAEQSPPDVVTFDAPFGVRFGMFICNDINLGGPTRALLDAGVRDIIFPTLWINGGSVGPAVGAQDGYARAHGVNLLAANGNELGLGSSGSGIWPADLTADSPQYYTSKKSVPAGEGWMGVADLVSPDPADSPVPAEVPHPTKRPMGQGGYKTFTVAPGRGVRVTATDPDSGLSCAANVTAASGSGEYVIVAVAGLSSGGWYSAYCAVVTAAGCSAKTGCLYAEPTTPLKAGGVVFSELSISSSNSKANEFRHTAICDGGLAVRPRSALSLAAGGGDARELRLSGAGCPLMSAWIEGRAQAEDEQPACPYDKYPCSTADSLTSRWSV